MHNNILNVRVIVCCIYSMVSFAVFAYTTYMAQCKLGPPAGKCPPNKMEHRWVSFGDVGENNDDNMILVWCLDYNDNNMILVWCLEHNDDNMILVWCLDHNDDNMILVWCLDHNDDNMILVWCLDYNDNNMILVWCLDHNDDNMIFSLVFRL